MRPLLILLYLLPALLTAQSIGLHPPRLDWKQIQLPTGRVLFPEGYEEQAKRAASLIELLANKHAVETGEQLYDFDLVLQTENTVINGYVGLAPFRSEFYTTPPQTLTLLSTSDWVDLLTIHEFRHVQQTSNERRGLTRLLSYLQGQTGWALLSSVATPNWFTEGDAVIAETQLTAAGRGRTPAFSADLRSLLANDIVYPYRKARNGSYRDLVPDHYRYGYAMLTEMRRSFGPDFWTDIYQQGSRWYAPYPFSTALKRKAGISTVDLYELTMLSLQAEQDSFLRARGMGDGAQVRGVGEEIGVQDKEVRNYRFPQFDGQGRTLAHRRSYTRAPALVVVDPAGGPDEVLTTIGIQREPWLDVRGKLALWTQFRQHPRRTNENYSDLVLYELGTGRKRRITEDAHYLAATLSPDGNRIIAVHFEAMVGRPRLDVLNTANGAIIRSYELPADDHLAAWPRFSNDGTEVFYFGRNYAGVAIRRLDLASGNVTDVSERSPQSQDMLNVAPNGELVYISGRDGIDNVYAMDPDSGTPRQLSDVATGAYYPELGADGTLLYAAPTPRGNRLRRLALGPLDRLDERVFRPAGPNFFERSAAFTPRATNLSEELEVREFPVENFSNTLGGIRLHSWSFNGSTVSPGFEVAASNALSTIELEAEATYNVNEKRPALGTSIAYGGLFPVIEVGGEFRERRTLNQVPRQDTFLFSREEYQQTVGSLDLRVPLNWVNGLFSTGISPSLGLDYIAPSDLSGSEVMTGVESFASLDLGLSVSAQQQRQFQQVQTRLGFLANLSYDGALDGTNQASRTLLRSFTYLPGLWPTHGIRIDLDFQAEQAENLYQYPDQFQYARGFVAPVNDRVFRIGANYQLPVLYPELGLFGITYFKRIRLQGFYDYSQFTIDNLRGREASFTEQSVGGEIYFDNVWLNTAEFPIGVRVSYLIDADLFSSSSRRVVVELLFSGSF